MKNILVWFLICGFFINLVYADVGPAPAAPTVKVHLVKNDGTPETSITLVTYHCMDVDAAESSSMAPYPVNFSCENGLCTNDGGWYYKFNPCFSFPDGYFSYELNGVKKKTSSFSTDSEYDNYELTFNAETGENKGMYSSSGFCAPGFVLFGLVGASIMRK